MSEGQLQFKIRGIDPSLIPPKVGVALHPEG